MVVPSSGYHFPLKARDRIESMLDEGSFEEMDTGVSSLDPLKFNATSSYPEKLKANQGKTKETDTVISGVGTMGGIKVSIAVMDFRFMAASLGSAAGEKLTRTIERGVDEKIPVIIVSASGGARMQEGILSLMQLAKTSAALARLSEAKIPYFSILTNPTMAGVMASYASLGDVIIAEPEALIGFAGPRVIKETTQQDLPAGFQTSEFLLERGLIDLIIPRGEMRDRMINLLKALYRAPKAAKAS
jgi:acetyl-CoA carboxylase carboxyl transferase subunit beta